MTDETIIYDQEHVDHALRTLANMEVVVKRERLVKGDYSRFSTPDPDALCRGHLYCLMGTMVISHDADRYLDVVDFGNGTGYVQLVPFDDCDANLASCEATDPALGLVHSALDAAVGDLVGEGGKEELKTLSRQYGLHGPAEAFFEKGTYMKNAWDLETDLDVDGNAIPSRTMLLKLIGLARVRVEATPVGEAA